MTTRLVQVPGGGRVAELVAIHRAAATAAYAHIFDGPFPTAEAADRWRRHPGPVVVAEEGGLAVGFVAAAAPTLEALYVLPTHAGRGLGSALLARLDELACAEPAAVVDRLWVLADNRAGRRFWERRGWRPTGESRPAGDAGGVVEHRYGRAPSVPPDEPGRTKPDS